MRVETEELGITAGLQDRVAQVMEGCVLMDFNKEAVDRTGNGVYSRVDVALLPPLFLAYCLQPEDISLLGLVVFVAAFTALGRVPHERQAAMASGRSSRHRRHEQISSHFITGSFTARSRRCQTAS